MDGRRAGGSPANAIPSQPRGSARQERTVAKLKYINIERVTTVRLKVEENQLVDVFGEIGTRVEGLKGA